MVLERDFQHKLVKRLRTEIPGSIVMKADANQVQGIPDLLILAHGRFASLEVKRSASASHRPNQDYFVQKINDDGGFASFVDPSNEDDVVDRVKRYLSEA